MIKHSVGRGGRNLKPDVRIVQNLLNGKGKLIPSVRPLTVDGICGTKTKHAIFVYQKNVVKLREPDGRVDPNGATLKSLNRGHPAVVKTEAAAPEGESFRYIAGELNPLSLLPSFAIPYLGAREAKGNRMGTDPRMKKIFEADEWKGADGKTDGYAWCCAFVSLILQEFLAKHGSSFQNVTPPRESYTKYFEERWAPAQKCLIFKPNDTQYSPHAGDVVMFKFSHIGIVEAVRGGRLHTIEGNAVDEALFKKTNDERKKKGLKPIPRNRADGTDVERKSRSESTVRSYIRLPLSDAFLIEQAIRMSTA